MNFLEERKQAIAKSAINVFSKKGFTHASMKDIMIEAQVSRGGLYNHFDNIESVFLESLRLDDEEQLSVEKIEGEGYFDCLWHWIQDMFFENEKLLRAKVEFFFLYSSDDYPYLQERHDYLSQSIVNFINTGIDHQEFNHVDTLSFSRYLIASIDGLLLSMCSYPSSIESELKYFKHALKSILQEG